MPISRHPSSSSRCCVCSPYCRHSPRLRNLGLGEFTVCGTNLPLAQCAPRSAPANRSTNSLFCQWHKPYAEITFEREFATKRERCRNDRSRTQVIRSVSECLCLGQNEWRHGLSLSVSARVHFRVSKGENRSPQQRSAGTVRAQPHKPLDLSGRQHVPGRSHVPLRGTRPTFQ